MGEAGGQTPSQADQKSFAERAKLTVTRRDFLIGAGAGAATAVVVLGGAAVATKAISPSTTTTTTTTSTTAAPSSTTVSTTVTTTTTATTTTTVVVYGCANPHSGRLRSVGIARPRCRGDESLIFWNATRVE